MTGGCKKTFERAIQSFTDLGKLLLDLRLKESASKAPPPSTAMPYLGILFNTLTMQMSIPLDKVAEVLEEVSLWVRKATATKKTLQQLLGKLFWVSRVVKFSRCFIGRLLSQLKDMHPFFH